MPKKKEIPFTLYFTPQQIEELYERLLENDPEAIKRLAGKKLIKLLNEVHANVPDVSEEEVEKDIKEAIRAIRGQS